MAQLPAQGSESANDKILLSVILLAYNHQDFIARALDSVLMQETNFRFEIIIGEDCSTDRTREVIDEYYNKYPGRFIKLYRPKNVGVRKNVSESETLSQGQYLAFLECDDFWRDPRKLQQQVDFLERNPDYSVCYHDGNVVDENEEIIREHEFDVRQDWSREDLISGKGFATINTALFRNLVHEAHSQLNVFNGDTLRWHLLGFHGKCKYLDEIQPSAYRIHSGGVWSSLGHRKKLEYLLDTFSVIRKNILRHCRSEPKILKLHDRIYYRIFCSYLTEALRNASLADIAFCLHTMVMVKQLKSVPILGYCIFAIAIKAGRKALTTAKNLAHA